MVWHATWRVGLAIFGLSVAAGACFLTPVVLVVREIGRARGWW